MSVINKTNKHYKRSQKGRSMVEMLGVLAIIGVLSVGGVYGYGVAMKKHKANEALHKASLMATTISSYAMSNNGNLPTPNSDFANFGYETALTDKGTQFDLMVKGIGFDVCTQMKNVKGGMVREVVCDEATGNATITYYKNLATNEAEGEKSPTGGSENKEPVIDKTSQEWLNCMSDFPEGHWAGTTAEETCTCLVSYDMNLCDCVFSYNFSVEVCQCLQEELQKGNEEWPSKAICRSKFESDFYPCEAERREIDWDEQDNPIDYVSLPKGKAQEVYTEKGRSYECGYCDDCSMSGWFWFYIEPEYPY